MPYVTYLAKREIELTGFSKTGTDLSSIGSDDSFNAATTDLSGMLIDQWLQAAGFVRNAGWFQVKSNSTSTKILTSTPPVTHLRLPGVAGNYASTPDSAANSITGDIDIRCRIAPVHWTPDPSANELVTKFVVAGNQRSYIFSLTSSGGFPQLAWSADGTALITKAATVSTGFVDGSAHWVRVTLDVDNGAAGNDVKFYVSDDGVVWTQLGATVTTAGTTSIFNGTAPLELGQSAPNFAGRFYYAELRNGIGGAVVVAFDPSRGTRGASSFVALTGETWTINTSGTPPALLQGSLLTYEGAEYLSLPGVAGNYASTPDSVAVSITGDLDLRVRCALTDYTPAASNVLVSKYINAGQRSYDFFLSTDGKLNLTTSSDGTASSNAISSTATGVADGATKWLRVTRISSTGVVKFYTSDDYDPATGAGAWTQLGADSSNTSGAMFDGTDAVRVGQDSGSPASGKFYYAEIRSGVAGEVKAVFDPGRAAAAATTLTAYTGEVWTINTSGSPPAALVRVTPVTITGYKRGYGQSYNLEFKAEQVDRKVKVRRSMQQPIGGGAPEVLRYRQEVTIDVLTEILAEASPLPQFREFLASVSAGEIFTFDRYGTVSVPVEPHQAILENADYDEQRVLTTMQQKLAFTVRLID